MKTQKKKQKKKKDFFPTPCNPDAYCSRINQVQRLSAAVLYLRTIMGHLGELQLTRLQLQLQRRSFPISSHLRIIFIFIYTVDPIRHKYLLYIPSVFTFDGFSEIENDLEKEKIIILGQAIEFFESKKLYLYSASGPRHSVIVREVTYSGCAVLPRSWYMYTYYACARKKMVRGGEESRHFGPMSCLFFLTYDLYHGPTYCRFF